MSCAALRPLLAAAALAALWFYAARVADSYSSSSSSLSILPTRSTARPGLMARRPPEALRATGLPVVVAAGSPAEPAAAIAGGRAGVPASRFPSAALAGLSVALVAAAYAVGRLLPRRHPAPPPAANFLMAAMTGDGDDENDLDDLLGLAETADLAGAIPPLGYFDPLGLAAGKPVAELKVWREAELKHGRIAMLATLGFLVAERFHPLFGGGLDGPALQSATRPELLPFWALLLPLLFLAERPSLAAFQAPGVLRDRHEPGDYGFDPLGLKPANQSAWDAMQCRELSNGRLAMVAVLGMVAQELLTGRPLL